MPDKPIEDLMNGPYANDEPPVRVIMRIGRIVEERIAEALAEHERRYHRGHARWLEQGDEH